MNDPRFRREMEWTQRLLAQRDEALAGVRELGEPGQLLAVAIWLLDLDDVAWMPALVSATPSLPAQFYDDLQKYLGGSNDLSREGWWLVAEALARSALWGSPSSDRIQMCARKLERSPQWVYAAFVSAFSECLAALNIEMIESWLAEFERPLSIALPERDSELGRVRVFTPEPDMRLKDPFDVWHQPPMALEAVDSYVPNTLLRQFAPERWLRAIERWEDVPLVTAALFGDHVLHDREALLRWLRAASPVFNQNGVWSGSLAALILSERVTEAATRLFSAVASGEMDDLARVKALEVLCSDELPRFFRDAWSSIMMRTDGMMIATALHAEFVDPTKTLPDDARVLDVARTTLCEVLNEWGVDAQKVISHGARRRQGRSAETRVAHASEICAIISAQQLAVARGEELDGGLFPVLLESMRNPGSDWRWLIERDALSAMLQPFVSAAARRGDTLDRLESLYLDLEPARRRGEYGRTYLEADIDLSSILVLVVLLGVLDEMSLDEPRVRARVRACMQWSTRLWLTSSPGIASVASPELMFAFSLRLCARGAPDLVQDALAAARSDPKVAALAVTSLLEVLPRSEIEGLLRESDDSLSSLITRANTWADATLDRDARAAARRLVERVAAL